MNKRQMKSRNSSIMVRLLAIVSILTCLVHSTVALDIGPMTWTPRANWINVKSPTAITGGVGAVGDGVADDTAAIQAVITWVETYGGNVPHHTTIYFPAGTYKITSSLNLTGTYGTNIIGCGSNTIISWGGVTGGAMFETYSNAYLRCLGLTWNGNNTAACAYEFNGGSSPTRHENESFKNFTAPATYSYYNASGNLVNSPEPPTAAIVSGMRGMDSEVSIFNCAFSNCTTGLVAGCFVGNYLMWVVDGCEFENCGQGVDYYGGSGMIVTNCHFSHTSGADITGGHDMRVRRCTSSSSGWFFDQNHFGFTSGDILEDCWIDSWADTYGTVYFSTWGPNEVFDCSFTNPPANTSSPICPNIAGALLTSNNYAPGLPIGIGLANSNNEFLIGYNVQPGLRGVSISSPNQTFLNSAYPADSTHILDVTKAPYSAPNNYNGDAGPAIQAAITAAKTANNGTIVYIPGGIYQIGETLNVSGSNYTIQGEGLLSDLVWSGASGGTMISVTTPKNISIQLMDLCVADAVTTAINQTSTGTSSITYDEIICQGYNPSGGNPGAAFALPNGKGLVLSNLPAGSTVYMPHVTTPLNIVNCGAAQILSKFLQMGQVTVSGTGATTGFIGSVVSEGGWWQQGAYNITVNDNQSLILNDYYTEGAGADLSISRGGGTGTGRVTIQGINEGIGNNQTTAAEPSVTVNNYQGRLFYGSSNMLDSYNGGVPIQITQTGTNPIDMIFPSMVAYGGLPATSLGTGANLVFTQSLVDTGTYSTIPETPNPLTQADYLSLAQGLDHVRQLSAVDLSVQFGVTTDAPPIAQYPFEGNILDMTTSYNGTNAGGIFVPGLGVNAINFNGSSAYATVPKSISGTFSVSMWVLTSDTGATGQWYKGRGLVDAYTGANKADWGTALNAGKFSFGIGNPDTTLTSTTAINDNNWHQVVATRNTSTGAMQIYVDGVLNNSITGPTGTRGAATNFRVGSIQTGVSGGFLNGTIDEVQVYNYVLSATDVAQNYNHTKGSLPSPTGLVAYWKLDETAGPLSRDSSPSCITGTWNNSPGFTTDKPAAITFTDAGSLNFAGGSNQFVQMPNVQALPTGSAPFTLCGWGKTAGAGSFGLMGSFGTASTGQAVWIGANGTSLGGGGWGNYLPLIPNFWDGNWHFIALTYDGTTASLYADGVLKESAAASYNIVQGAAILGNGVDTSLGYSWPGPIDDMRIYNRALTAAQVANLAAGSLNP